MNDLPGLRRQPGIAPHAIHRLVRDGDSRCGRGSGGNALGSPLSTGMLAPAYNARPLSWFRESWCRNVGMRRAHNPEQARLRDR